MSDLKGDICIIFDALKKIEKTQDSVDKMTKEDKKLIRQYQRLEDVFRSLSVDTI